MSAVSTSKYCWYVVRDMGFQLRALELHSTGMGDELERSLQRRAWGGAIYSYKARGVRVALQSARHDPQEPG